MSAPDRPAPWLRDARVGGGAPRSLASGAMSTAPRLAPVGRVGFAGLGAMGAGITQRLLDAGLEVVGWNRTKAKAQPLLDAGMGWADTPRELAAQVDVLFTMLTNTAAIEATADGDDGVLAGIRPGTVWADISTIAPDASVALGERVAATGAAF